MVKRGAQIMYTGNRNGVGPSCKLIDLCIKYDLIDTVLKCIATDDYINMTQ